MTPQELRKTVDERKVRLSVLQNDVRNKENTVSDLVAEADVLAKAKWVISEVATLTQGTFTEYIESLVTMAIRSVYDRPLWFLVNFKIFRNKSECFLSVYEGEEQPREKMLEESFVPEDEEGGGLLDVISFALRVVLWSLERPRSNNSLWLDEPMKFLGALTPKAGELFKQVSHDLGIQLVINTHEDDLAEIADAAWRVTKSGRESIVRQILGMEMGSMKKEAAVAQKGEEPSVASPPTPSGGVRRVKRRA